MVMLAIGGGVKKTRAQAELWVCVDLCRRGVQGVSPSWPYIYKRIVHLVSELKE